ncbi:type I-E CRISPR-associated protein Cas6/Cse3/CasE [Lactobacillus sp. ESL0679]|uniref:type I-E CRISPR-associated protein Cas6/Cse3/CasE n=1 Tax=Lactobacillus sp. ESL0679 TaxID=2983209 RepID=UPI0023F882CD|nr:type I-E CRISPR-associated protein Cas6/Cse3/CasE [Lactobacillus sp. ESL0679]MDF7682371.1 type I-E CRISPR-associated protein Cas6/Cse3/CasE [Lactobacillus sp. ESL0679]
MYLSRVEIDVNNRQKIKDLTQLSAFHNWVEQSFPDEIRAGKRLRHLWRLDRLSGKLYLLILSEAKPNPERLSRYGVAITVITKNYDNFLNQIKQGEIMQFRLTANPSYRPKDQNKVYPHVTVAQQMQWLADRAEKSGFQVKYSENEQSFNIVSRDWPLLSYRGNRRVRLSRVTFEGILQVIDADLFKKTLVNGLGREKAFGMGLMTVIPRSK